MRTREIGLAILSVVFLFSCTGISLGNNELSRLGFYGTPEQILAKLGTGTPGFREQFMLGQAYKQQKKYKEAISHFANSCFTGTSAGRLVLYPQPVYSFVRGYHWKSDLYDDAVFEIAQLFAGYGEHEYVVKFVDLLKSDGSALYRDAVLLKAQSLAARRDYGAALACLDRLTPGYRDEGSLSLIHIKRGSLFEKMEKKKEAIDAYLRVIALESGSWHAGIAVEQALRLLRETGTTPGGKERVALASALYGAKRYREALAYLDGCAQADSPDDPVRSLLVRTLTRLHDNARIAQLRMGVKGKGALEAAILRDQADEYWEMGGKAGAIPLYRELLVSGDAETKRLALERLSLYLEDRSAAGFENYLTQYKNAYTDENAEYFLWLLGRRAIRARQEQNAQALFEESIRRFPGGSYSGNCRFWLYKLYTAQKKEADAYAVFRDMVRENPDSYYTWTLLVATEKTAAEAQLGAKYRDAVRAGKNDDALFYHAMLFLKQTDLARRNKRLGEFKVPRLREYENYEKAIASMELSAANKTALQRMEKYFQVGYYPGIGRELQIIPRDDRSQADKFTALAHLAREYGNHFLAVHAGVELLKLRSLKENIMVQPEESVKAILPLAFFECVDAYAKEFRVPRHLVYGVLKAESLYNPSAVSPAGAAGLMQLMPATARGIARDLKLQSYNLADGCTSIRFGAQYLSWLHRMFDGQVEYIVAGYNAGAGNVQKWQRELPDPGLDYFTEFIPFLETRIYIRKTAKFQAQYRMVYGSLVQ